MSGTTEYIEAKVSIFFEPEHVACAYCPLLEKYSRDQCRRTGEYIIDPRFTVGRYCPLRMEDKHEELSLAGSE